MATSTPSQNSPGSGSGGGDRNRNRNRNRTGTRSRSRPRGDSETGERRSSSRSSASGDGGGSNRGYTKEKVPRRVPKPSLFQQILGIFGMGDGSEAKKKRSATPNPLARVGSTRVPEAGSRPEPATSRRAPRNAGDGPDRPERPARTRTPREPREKRETREPNPRRTPEEVEVTCERLYVGNLSYDASESDLRELFGGVGTVELAEVVSHKNTQRSKGYAFLEMGTIDEAKRAVDELHDKDFMGRKLVVSGAKSVGRQSNRSDRDGCDGDSADDEN